MKVKAICLEDYDEVLHVFVAQILPEMWPEMQGIDFTYFSLFVFL